MLRNTQHKALGYVHIPKALEELKRKFGDGARAETAAPVSPSSRVMRRQKRMLIQDLPESKRRNVNAEKNSYLASPNDQYRSSNQES